MQHKVKLTVIDKKLYPDLQAQYCADPASGACSCYHVGDEFIFERYGTADDFWHMGLKTLKQTVHTAEALREAQYFPIVQKHGTLYPVIFIQACRAAPLCADG